MPPDDKLCHVFSLLQQREEYRRAVSLRRVKAPPEEQAFYRVRNALQLKEGNRYADVLAYDRTAVGAEGCNVNANMVCDASGRSWIAAQVGPTRHVLRGIADW